MHLLLSQIVFIICISAVYVKGSPFLLIILSCETVAIPFLLCYTVFMKRNYQQEMEEIFQELGHSSPRLLLHSCCGPCSSSVLERLSPHFDLTLLWYNPNIWPQAEFDRRLEAQKKLISAAFPSVKLLVLPREDTPWYKAVSGLEKEPEGGARCTECFRLRLRESARLAAKLHCDYYCSTLTLSRHKDPVRINAIGEAFGQEYGVRWLPSEFKKRNGELRTAQLCEQFGIYRQNYCGCEYSVQKQ